MNPPQPQKQSITLPPGILHVLRAVARRDMGVRLAEFPVRLGIVLPMLLLAQAALDWVFNFPWLVRLFLLLGDAAIVGKLLYDHVVIPLRQRLDLRTAALRIEKTFPQFRTALISAVELTAHPTGSATLLRILVTNVLRQVNRTSILKQVVQTRGLKKRLGAMAVTLLVFAAAGCFFYPKSATLAQRILLSRVALPTRTVVVPVTRDAVIPTGSDFEMLAVAQGVIPKMGRISVFYADKRREILPVNGDASDLSKFAFTVRNVRQPFRYHFELNDGVGAQFEVTPKILPSLSSLRFTQIYPRYMDSREVDMPVGDLALLPGGKLRLQGESTQPLKSAVLKLQESGKKIPMDLSGPDKRLVKMEIPIPDSGLVALSIHLENRNGDASVNDPVYRVRLIKDRPPSVVLKAPRAEETTLLPGDRLPLAFTARDDFGVKKVELVYEVFRPGADGQLDPAEKGRIPMDRAVENANGASTFNWDLSKLIPPLVIDSFVTVWVEAEDGARQTGISRRKNLVIVSEAVKRAELLDALASKAADIERLYNSQRKLNEKTDTIIGSGSTSP